MRERSKAVRALVAEMKAARLWAGKIAVACGWPQEVRRFQPSAWRTASPT